MIPAYLEVDIRHFSLKTKLTQGGLGEIYLAEITEERLLFRAQGVRQCIAKILRSNSNVQSKQAFVQEVSIMTYLSSHKNIAKIIGYNLAQQILLMKFYPLGSLNDFIFRGIPGVAYDLKVIFNITHGIANALKFMHARQIAHCDIKPANILLEQIPQQPFIQPVLTDFGISRVLNPQGLAVKAFRPVDINGVSLLYAAPETILTFRMQVQPLLDPRVISSADIYAFAVILYEMVTRRKAWSA
jgi:serine/threonine-protein kinase